MTTDASSRCFICNSPVGEPIWSSGTQTVSSLCQILPANTTVYACESCGHIQSTPIPDLADYYDTNYELLTDSDEQDQIYKVEGEKKIYRYEYQAKTMLGKLLPTRNAKFLDYGATKGATLRIASEAGAAITPYFFDVSDSWVPFWQKMVPLEQTATYELPASWSDTFDAVVSFFVLEHVVDPVEYVNNARRVLKDNGTLYFIVPNPFVNIVDLTVADHTHHYTESSLRTLLEHNGFSVVEIDDQIHDRAFVVTARKSSEELVSTISPDAVAASHQKALELAAYWTQLGGTIDAWADEVNERPVAIYGGGVYGARIASQLANKVNVVQFLDQNVHMHGTSVLGIPVNAPAELRSDVNDVFVGINPLQAKAIINDIRVWDDRLAPRFYFL